MITFNMDSSLKNFPSKITSLIMQCVSTILFQILINGISSKKFMPSKGIRQGDPLSPYLFILCVEGLLCLIKNVVLRKSRKGIRMGPRAPQLSHIFFADDYLLFLHDTHENTQTLLSVFHTYEIIYGQKVTISKSLIFFSQKEWMLD